MNPEKIALQIKKIRKENNLTQQEFAQFFGVTYQAVSKWERALNVPDISILTEICNKYGYDIHEFLNGQDKKKKNNIVFLGGVVLVLFFFVFLFFFFFFSSSTFHFKTLSSNCDNFEITGSMAYNKEKTSIYISNVSYCGSEKEIKYQNISCSLFETLENTNIKIDECKVEKNSNVSLEDFLKDVTFQVEDYAKMCKEYSTNSLSLEINARKEDGLDVTFKIPLKLENNCS